MAFRLVDTTYINFPEGQTENRIRTAQNQLGINALEFVRRVDAAMADINRVDPVIASLTYNTTERTVSTGLPERLVWQRSSEFVPGRPQGGGAQRGFQRPLYFYEIDLGYTRRSLMRTGLAQFNNHLRDIARAIRKGRRADVLNRLFDDSPWPLDDAGVGSSPGFAGSGVDDDEFVAVLPSGALTDENYTHYFQAADTEAGVHAAVLDALEALDNWNAPGTYYEMFGSIAAIDQLKGYRADDKFVKAGSTLVRPGEDQSQALVDAATYQGVYAERIRVRPGDHQIVGKNLVIYKSNGSNAPGNPLAYVYDELFGVDAIVEDRNLFPLVDASIQQTYGMGVGDSRTNAVVISIGGTPGVYAPPQIIRQ